MTQLQLYVDQCPTNPPFLTKKCEMMTSSTSHPINPTKDALPPSTQTDPPPHPSPLPQSLSNSPHSHSPPRPSFPHLLRRLPTQPRDNQPRIKRPHLTPRAILRHGAARQHVHRGLASQVRVRDGRSVAILPRPIGQGPKRA